MSERAGSGPGVHPGDLRDALCISGAGNRFYLIDARAHGLPADAAQRSRLACPRPTSRSAPGARFEPDGVLWVLSGDDPERLRMVLFNADGSRPEACGNGLRCLVHWAVDSGILAGGTGVVDTDGGPRAVRWHGPRSNSDGDLRVEVCLGQPRALPGFVLRGHAGEPSFTRVDLANPHAVRCVEPEALEQLTDPEFERLGERVQAQLPGGANVELVTRSGDGLTMRVFERGVGQTEACGTGSAAAAWVAAQQLGLRWPVAVRQPGGTLTIDRDDDGSLWLSGPVLSHGSASFTGAAWATCSTS